MKIKRFVLIFTPLFIYLSVIITTTDFTRIERYMFILIWLLIKYKYVWDDEKPIRITCKRLIIYAGLIKLERIISSRMIPIASMLSHITYEEASHIINSADHILLHAVIFAPIVEEWLFRGIGLKMAYNFFNNVHVAIFVQAILFGIMHFNWYQFLGAVPMGIINGYLYQKHKSLKLCIALHGIYNLCVHIQAPFP